MKKLIGRRMYSIIVLLVSIMTVFSTGEYSLAAVKPQKAAANVQSIKLTLNKLDMASIGTKCQLKAIIKPDSASDKSLYWSSSNESVAVVNTYGEITGVSKGVAVISAKTVDGGFTDYCVVNVGKQTVNSVTGISLNTSQKTIGIGKTFSITATALPANADITQVRWYSSDSSVATVDAAGKVTAVGEGNARIKAEAVDGNYTAACDVKVIEKISKVKLNKSTLNIKDGDVKALTATVSPEDAENTDVNWTSNKPAVASVDSDGNVYALSAGKAKITAVSAEDSSQSASCTVTVTKKQGKVPVTSVRLNKSSISIKYAGTYTLSATIAPANADIKAIKWTSSNEAVATVAGDGTVTGIAKGTTVVTAAAINGNAKTSCVVTVTNSAPTNVASVSIDKPYNNVAAGDSVALKATVLPAAAIDSDITWLSSDSSVAKVDSTGKVTAVSAGSALIIAKTKNGAVDFSIFKVIDKVDSVIISQNILNLSVGDNPTTLSALVKPDSVSMQDVTWTSSDNSVALVDDNGKVTPLAKGTATITATSVLDQTKSAVCYVTVKDAVKVAATGVKLNSSSLNLNLDSSITLKASVQPTNATTQSVVWSSSNEAVAKVSATGEVTAVSKGTAYITAKTVDGGYTTNCLVTVGASDVQVVNVTGVTLDKSSISLTSGTTSALTATIAPSYATIRTVKWSSSNESVAKVDSNGVVTAVSPGVAAIIVKTDDGGYTAYCTVTVTK